MDRIQNLIARISQELSRWASLSVDFEDQEGLDKWTRRLWEDKPITPLESFLCLPIPGLRRLSLCGVRGSLEGFFPQVPSLNAFEIKGGHTTKLNVPWSFLISFRYSSNQCSSDSEHLRLPGWSD